MNSWLKMRLGALHPNCHSGQVLFPEKNRLYYKIMEKIKDLRGLSREELRDKLHNIKKSLYEMRVQKETGRIDKPAKIRTARKDIARILTVLNEK